MLVGHYVTKFVTEACGIVSIISWFGLGEAEALKSLRDVLATSGKEKSLRMRWPALTHSCSTFFPLTVGAVHEV